MHRTENMKHLELHLERSEEGLFLMYYMYILGCYGAWPRTRAK